MRLDSNLLTRTAPRALVGGLRGIRAHTDVAAMVKEIDATITDIKTGLRAEIDDINTKLVGYSINGGGGRSSRPDDPEYTRTFASYFRNGGEEAALRDMNGQGHRAQIQAAMSVGSNPDGGYLAPTEWDREVRQAQRATSPMRQLATVAVTGVGAFSTVWSNDAFGSGWVGETAARPSTTTPAMSQIVFASGEIYANPAVSQRLIDDADFKLEEWLQTRLAMEFDRQEGIAFISGDGVNKPYGLLTYVTGGAAAAVHPGGTLDVVDTAAIGDIGLDDLIDFSYGLLAPYRQNASWLMSSSTAARLTRMKDADGNLIWRESLAASQPATLLGRPVEIDENMPAVANGALAIAFGDFASGYLINDRIGIRVLRDPFTNKPFVNLYSTKRVGAGVLDPRAIRLLRIRSV